MIFYPSGIAGKKELEMLLESGVQRCLVDPVDFPRVFGAIDEILLDSGAYREFKSGKLISLTQYIALCGKSGVKLCSAKDVIGDPAQSRSNWLSHALLPRGYELMPVWHWDSPRWMLDEYLDRADIVGIGGLVPLLRMPRDLNGDDKKARNKGRASVLDELYDIAFIYPGRLHIFGLCWPKAITKLKPWLHSYDTSIWLRGARYKEVFTIRTSTKGKRYLQCVKLKYYPEWASKVAGLPISEVRRQLCVENLRVLEEFSNG